MAIVILLAGLVGHDVVDLGGAWEVCKVPSIDGAPPAEGWEPAQVPGRISVGGTEELWYRRRLAPPDRPFRRAYLRLWGAKFAPRVLLGDREVGRGFDGFVPAVFDVTDALSAGEETLFVGCRNVGAMLDGEVDLSAPGRLRDRIRDHALGPIGSQWTACGLWEGVELILTGDLHIPDVFVKTSYRRRAIDIEVAVRNETDAALRGTLRAWIEPIADAPFIRGDANGDGRLDIGDAVKALGHLFLGEALSCADGADANDDGRLDIADPVRVLAYLFAEGPAPGAPYPSPGPDPTPDGLACAGDLPAFAPLPVELPPSQQTTVTLSASWEDPVLWSPEQPFLYRLRVAIGEEAAAVRFGFREFWCEGPHFLLNGVRRRLLASSCHPYVFDREAARREIALFKDLGCIAFRFHAQPWERYWYERADEMGLLVVHESALWCGYYKWDDEAFWRNAAAHVRGNVLRDRNHPSIVIWSVENEALHTSGGAVPGTAERLAALGDAIRALDPTRPIMFEGDEDPAGSADIINLHYPQEPPGARLWPEAAWWLERPTRVQGWPRTVWEWTREKPLYIGEFLWLSPRNPHTPSIFTGDAAYADPSDARYETKARSWEMAIRAYRGLDVSGMCPWNAIKSDDRCRDANRRAYRKLAGFLREYETAFFGGTLLSRRLYLHNDLPERVAGEVAWDLRLGGSAAGEGGPPAGQGAGPPAAEGTLAFDLEPAETVEARLTIPLPEVARVTPVTLTLRIIRGGEEAFRDAIPWSIAPLEPLPAPGGIAVYDPAGTAGAALDAEGVAYDPVADPAAIPPGARLLVVGEDAFASGEEIVFDPAGVGARLEAFVRAGGQVLVLKQGTLSPILPLVVSARASTIAFARVPDHPILEGLGGEDLRFWYPGHVVAEGEIVKPAGSAALSLIDSGSSDGLTSASLLELPVGRGRYLLCQLAIVEKIRTAPAARAIWRNLLGSFPSWEAEAADIAIAYAATPFLEVLRGLAPMAETLSLPADLSGYSVLVLDAGRPLSPPALASVQTFLAGDGTLLLHGLTPESLPSYAPLIGDLGLVPNASPPILANPSPPTRGMADFHFQWFERPEGNQRPDTRPGIAPFVIERSFDPVAYATIEAEDLALPARGVTRHPDGLWFYANATVSFGFDAAEAGPYLFCLAGWGTPLDGIYPQGFLAIDGRALGAVTFGREPACHTLEARLAAGPHTGSFSFVNDAYAPPQDRNLFLDAIRYGPDPGAAANPPLLQPRALSVLQGRPGTILIDQVHAEGAGREGAIPARQYLSLLLRNLGGRFLGDRYGVAVGADSFVPRNIGAYDLRDGIAYVNSNGEIVCRVRWAGAARTRFLILAGGTALGGIWPHVAFELDGAVRAAFDVRGGAIEPYPAGPFDVSAGEHEIAIAFTNDAYDPPADRNLHVAGLILQLADGP